MLFGSLFTCTPGYQKVAVGAFSVRFLPVAVGWVFFILFITQVILLIGWFCFDTEEQYCPGCFSLSKLLFWFAINLPSEQILPHHCLYMINTLE